MQKLAHERDKLKAALAETLRKKEQLFNEARALYLQLSEVKAQHSLVLDKVTALNGSQQLLAAVKMRLLKTESPTNSPADSQQKNSELTAAAAALAQTAEKNEEIRRIFHSYVSSEGVLQGNEALLRVMSFAKAVLTHFYAKGSRVSAFEQMISDSEKLMQALPFQTSRVAQLNDEIAQTIERSKDTVATFHTAKSQDLLDLKLDVAERQYVGGEASFSDSFLLPSDSLDQRLA